MPHMHLTQSHGLLTIEEARAVLPVSYDTMRKLLINGEIKGAIFGKKWRTRAEWVQEYIARMTSEQSKRPRERRDNM